MGSRVMLAGSKPSSFVRDVLVVMTGSAAAQVVGFALSRDHKSVVHAGRLRALPAPLEL